MNECMSLSDFVRMFELGEGRFHPFIIEIFKSLNLSYHISTKDEFSEYIFKFLKILEEKRIPRTREENLQAFEKGWTENFTSLKKSSLENYDNALKPKYFRRSNFLRYNNQIIVSNNSQIEYDAFTIARLCIFQKYLQGAKIICELGCGSCGNLLLLSKFLPYVELIGLDWTNASVKIIQELSGRLTSKISGNIFDLLSPNTSVTIPEGSAIITIHAFEQLGKSFECALEFIIRSKPSIVVQYEPVLEFYSEHTLLDFLSLKYCSNRDYLKGYFSKLKDLERKGIIKFIDSFRPFLGGELHEASVLVWKPI